MKKNTVIIILAALLIIGGLCYWVYRLKQNIAEIETSKQVTEAGAKIDSVTVKQSAIIDTIKHQSQNSADAATNLIKNLPNEKTTVKDTTYSAMCDYITNYRPD